MIVISGYFKKLLFLLSICVYTSFVLGEGLIPVSDKYSTNINTYLVDFSENIKQWQSEKKYIPTNPKEMIFNFCAATYTNGGLYLDAISLYLDPRQSAFLYFLCNDIMLVDGFFPTIFNNPDTSYLKQNTWKNLGLGDRCHTDGKLSQCDLANNIPKMFHAVVGDYIDIQQAAVYGNFFGKKNIDLPEMINEFGKTYFFTSLCDKTDSTKCLYPQTYDILEKYSKKANKLIEKTHAIDHDKIYTQYKDALDVWKSQKGEIQYGAAGIQGCTDLDKSQRSYDILMCGLYGANQDSLSAFINLLYNELWFFELWTEYYQDTIIKYPSLTPGVFNFSIRQITDKRNNVIMEIQNEVAYAKGAVTLSLDMLKDMYMTFPLHIGYLMYHETLLRFRTELVKIVTPLYTLYDKLRNVQEQE